MRCTLVLGALLGVANALPRPFLTVRDMGLSLPSNDPFYQPPEGFEQSEPGTILRSRQFFGQLQAFNGFKEGIADSYQLLYRTTDSFGGAEATITTVLIPPNANPNTLLSYQMFEDSAHFDCAPSFALQQGAENPTENLDSENTFINAALERGWYISIADYEGRNAAFTAGVKAGHATLDAIRAVLNSSEITKIAPDAKTVMWGYSGGSIPTQFAAEQQASYAPDLSDSLLGATAGGIIANLSATLELIDNTGYAGLGIGGLKGFSQEYPQIEQYVKEHLKDEKKDSFNKAGTLCREPLEKPFKNAHIFGFLDNENEILLEESLQPIFQANIMGKQTPRIPEFLYHSVNDEVSPIWAVENLVDTCCENGGRITFHKDMESEHAILSMTGAPVAIDWIQDRFDGVPVPEGCGEDVDKFGN